VKPGSNRSHRGSTPSVKQTQPCDLIIDT